MNEADLFTEALNRADPAERAAFLDQACDRRFGTAAQTGGAARRLQPEPQPARPAPLVAGRVHGDRRPVDSDADRRAAADGATQTLDRPDPNAATTAREGGADH